MEVLLQDFYRDLKRSIGAVFEEQKQILNEIWDLPGKFDTMDLQGDLKQEVLQEEKLEEGKLERKENEDMKVDYDQDEEADININNWVLKEETQITDHSGKWKLEQPQRDDQHILIRNLIFEDYDITLGGMIIQENLQATLYQFDTDINFKLALMEYFGDYYMVVCYARLRVYGFEFQKSQIILCEFLKDWINFWKIRKAQISKYIAQFDTKD